MAPGARAVLMSFNHDTGKWETVGGMTVSDDGKLVCTDPGVGIRQPGWHGMEGPPPVNPPPKSPLTATGPFSPPTGGGGCKPKTDANCQTHCNETQGAASLECDRNFDTANAACTSVACQEKAAADRDECKKAAVVFGLKLTITDEKVGQAAVDTLKQLKDLETINRDAGIRPGAVERGSEFLRRKWTY